MEELINRIIEACDNLPADDAMVVTEFGINKDLTLHIDKDCDYHPDIDVDAYNMVQISTMQNDEWVDDTGDTYVTDGTLYRELERIWNYRNFNTF